MGTQVTNRRSSADEIVDLVELGELPPEIAEINERNALTIWGSKAVVVHEDVGGAYRIRNIETFKSWHGNRSVVITDDAGNTKRCSLGTAWLTHPRRRQYEGFEFFPNPDGVAGHPNFLNLWRGFSVEPSKDGSYALFKDHILNNICNSEPALYAYVFGWFAQMMQKPRERLGTALVLRGMMGTGKSKLGEVFGSLIARHYQQVDESRYVTGNFNSHMADCLLLQADEAVWAGDKAAEGRLKGLITSETQLIEGKGIEPVRMPNYVHCIMTSNEGWVVPAGLDERRFCVLDVNPRRAQDSSYFHEMSEELNAGGRNRLLHDLLNFDLTSVNLRRIPKTQALLDQKLRSLESIDRYWFDRLWEGITLSDGTEWLDSVGTEAIFQDYLKVSAQIGERRRKTKSQLGERLAKLGVTKNRPTERSEEGKVLRPRHYLLPKLADARANFDRLVGQEVNWNTVTDADSLSDDQVP